MIDPDYINGTFELLGGAFLLNHARVLWKTRQAHGVSLLSVIFFSGWGIWNCFYYPHLQQMFSFYAGMFIAAANIFWMGSIFYLRTKSQKPS